MNARLQANQARAFLLDAEQSLGQIAVQLPGATAVFRRTKLDFCCGGQISLRQAAEDKGLDLQALLAELNALQRTEQQELSDDPASLIDHILTRYHAVHRTQLPELIRMARRVEAVHRDNPQVPAGLAELLETMEETLLDHMAKEEQILFPMLLAGDHPFVGQPIGMMRSEHLGHGAMLERVAALTNGATPPQGACNTWCALYAGIAQLNADLVSHIHLENNLLFAQFDTPKAVKSACCGSCGG